MPYATNAALQRSAYQVERGPVRQGIVYVKTMCLMT